MAVIDQVLTLADGSEFPFMDSGVPVDSQPYVTCIFIPGLAFKHRTFEALLSTLPPNTRLIAYTQRGFSGSSPFSPDDAASPDGVRSRLGRDVASIICTIVSQLELLKIDGSSIKVFAWSLGGLSLLMAYSLLADNKLPEAESRILSKEISELLFYEPPAAALAIHQHEGSLAEFDRIKSTTRPEDAGNAFFFYISSVWHYDGNILQQIKAGSLQDWDMKGKVAGPALFEDESFRNTIEPVVERAAIPLYLTTFLRDSDDNKALVKAAWRQMLEVSGVKRVKGLVGSTTFPECIDPSVQMVRYMQETAKSQALQTKAGIHLLEGINHFGHMQNPKLMWDAVLQ